MLTDRELGTLKPRDKTFKVTDRDGMYAAILPTGTISFRYDYRLNGRRGGNASTELYNVDRVMRSEELDQLPKDYSGLPPKPAASVPTLGPPLPGDLGPAIVQSQQPPSLPNTSQDKTRKPPSVMRCARRPRPPPGRRCSSVPAIRRAALVTGINSDLPGSIITEVTQPVYDTATGRYLLIPYRLEAFMARDRGFRKGTEEGRRSSPRASTLQER